MIESLFDVTNIVCLWLPIQIILTLSGLLFSIWCFDVPIGRWHLNVVLFTKKFVPLWKLQRNFCVCSLLLQQNCQGELSRHICVPTYSCSSSRVGEGYHGENRQRQHTIRVGPENFSVEVFMSGAFTSKIGGYVIFPGDKCNK